MDLPMKEVHDPIKLINNFQPTGISYDFGVKLSVLLLAVLMTLI